MTERIEERKVQSERDDLSDSAAAHEYFGATGGTIAKKVKNESQNKEEKNSSIDDSPEGLKSDVRSDDGHKSFSDTPDD